METLRNIIFLKDLLGINYLLRIYVYSYLIETTGKKWEIGYLQSVIKKDQKVN